MAKFALEGRSNTAPTAEYRTTLHQERPLAEEIAQTRRQLDVQHQDAFRPLSLATYQAVGIKTRFPSGPRLDRGRSPTLRTKSLTRGGL
jgi:hypothetical protein